MPVKFVAPDYQGETQHKIRKRKTKKIEVKDERIGPLITEGEVPETPRQKKKREIEQRYMEKMEADLKQVDEPTSKEEIKQKYINQLKVYNNPDLSYMIANDRSIYIFGPTGSGKTNLGMHILRDLHRNPKTRYDELYIVNPTEYDRIQAGKPRENWTDINDPNRFYEKPDEDLWDKVVANSQTVKGQREDGTPIYKKSVIVYDDVTQYERDLKDPKSVAARIVTMGRHYNTQIILIVHDLLQCSPLIRGCVGDVFALALPNKPEHDDHLLNFIRNFRDLRSKKDRMEVIEKGMKQGDFVIMHIPLLDKKYNNPPFIFIKKPKIKT